MRKKKFGVIRGRLVITYLSIIVLTLLFIATYILASISQYLYNQKKVETMANANIIANIVVDYMKNDVDMIPYAIKQLNLSDSVRVIITNEQAKVVFDSAVNNNIEGKFLINEEVMSAIRGQDVVTVQDEKDVGKVVRGAVSVISDSKNIGVVYLSEAAKTTEDFIADIRWLLLVISLVVCVLIGVLSSVMADVIISPIEKLTGIIKGMEAGSLTERVPVSGKDEIAQLGDAFNKLTDRMAEMEDKRRMFVSNASHELKTPLSSIKLLSESILSMPQLDEDNVREFMADINGEIDRLTKIIDRLLSLTKLDVESDTLDLQVTDINELAERISKSLKPVADKKNIKLSLMTDQEVLAMVDREKFWQVIYNVSDNAIKYTPAGGTVSLYVFNEGEFCRVEVLDNGIGIPQEEIDKIFDRFYRVDKARSRESGGTGLGLSIVNDVVSLHKGKILVDSTENEGTKFIIIVPKNLGNRKEGEEHE